MPSLIKGSLDNHPFVVVLGRAFGNVRGPYVYFKEDTEVAEYVVSFGENWTFHFPDAINFNNPGRADLGTLLVAPEGLCVHCHAEGGRQFVSSRGEFVQHDLYPFIQDWKLILFDDGDTVVDIYPPNEH